MRPTVLVLAALVGASCTTSGKLRSDSASVRGEIEQAKKSGASHCAPGELAVAETNVEFADSEMVYGDPGRAADHLKVARTSIQAAESACAPRPEETQKKIIIEKTDRDGDGVPDVDDWCPDEPGPPENHGCPIVKDSDGDGIPDDIDRCPLDAEDKDGFQDEDGCPDPDNDGDGIVDKADACPNDPGPIENQGCPLPDRDHDGVPDKDDMCPDVPGPAWNHGCPDGDRDGDGIPDSIDKCPDEFGPPPDGCPKKYSLVEVTKEKIRIKQQVKYASTKFRVLKSSYPLLDEVAQALKDFPKMRVVIEGHTDNRGNAATNMKLSQRRAEAVLDYLTAKGVAPERLEAIGYGSTNPIASNKTIKGRTLNRRTEFKIVALE